MKKPPLWAIALLLGCTAVARTPHSALQTVVLTFDDATASHRTVVAPLLNKYGFGATFFICEFRGFEDKSRYMSWEQIRELSEMGFEIGNHTRTHCAMSRLNPEQTEAEIAYIEQKCTEYQIPRPVSFAYPGYDYSPEGIDILRRRGYRYARHGGDRPYSPGVSDPMMIPSYAIHNKDNRTLEFLKTALSNTPPGETVILCLHGVPDLAHDFVSTSPKDFEKILRLLKKRHCRVVALNRL